MDTIIVYAYQRYDAELGIYQRVRSGPDLQYATIEKIGQLENCHVLSNQFKLVDSSLVVDGIHRPPATG